MARLHMKGYILRLLNHNNGGLWDYEIAEKTLAEYGYSGAYWLGTIRVTLTDLFSGGLIEEMEDKLDTGQHFGPGKVLVRFQLTDFGRERMQETGLM